jgi:hypothetical protein
MKLRHAILLAIVGVYECPTLHYRAAQILEGTEAMVRNETGRGVGKERDAMVRVFHLVRDEDISAVSGLGTAAVGAFLSIR